MISLRNCKQCGAIFDAVVVKDKNIYCEKCREIIDIQEADRDYSAIANEYNKKANKTILLDNINDIDEDILIAAMSVALPTKPQNPRHRPFILDDFGKSVK